MQKLKLFVKPDLVPCVHLNTPMADSPQSLCSLVEILARSLNEQINHIIHAETHTQT